MPDEFDDESIEDSEGIKNLRKQYDAQKKEMKQLQEQLASYLQKERATTVAETLKAKGVDPKFSKFYNNEDASTDAVEKWIAEQVADGIFPSQQSEQDAANAAAAQRITSVGRSNDSGQSGGVDFRSMSPAEAQRAMASMSREQLQEMGWIPKDNLHVV